MALGTWALVQNVAAVAIGVTVLATIHTDLSSDWIHGYAYPALAVAGAVALTFIAAGRLRRRIRETHTERWSDRRAS
jgi:adenosylmethionine-8-amino-7-oxononanoate aminotransferase